MDKPSSEQDKEQLGDTTQARGAESGSPAQESARIEDSLKREVNEPEAVKHEVDSSNSDPSQASSASTTRGRGRNRWPIPQPPDFSSRGKLELSGERIVKMTLELPAELIDRLSQWELAYATSTGRRVYRERVLDAALAALPERIADIVTMARALPEEYLEGTVETVGTRVRASTERRLRLLRPEFRAQRVRDVYQRHVYTAAIMRYLDFLDSVEGEEGKK